MRVCQIGNFGAPFSTENEVRRGLEANGHHVIALQENEPIAFGSAREMISVRAVDVVMWTRTRWNPPVPAELPLEMLLAASRHGVPVVGYHLDRWWGLRREREIGVDPFFSVDLLVTADGGHDEQWAARGIEHVWFPPAVDAGQARSDGTYRPEMASDVAFVGSWRPGYHPEWEHRAQLVAFLKRRFGDRCRFWPLKGEPAVRGPALADLYRSAKVTVGDSCLAGGATRYWSDRIPETLGRGGYLLHPAVEGLEEHFISGTHLATWDLGDWEGLARGIDWALEHPAERDAIARAGRAHVLDHHIYEVRMRELGELLVRRAFLSRDQVAA